MLMYYLLGKGVTRIKKHPIKSTNKIVLLHVTFSERAKEILNIVDLCGAKVYDNNNDNNDKIWW